MSLAALGCDPTATGDSLSDIGDVALGTLGYSPAGGLYIAVQADGAIAAAEICTLEPNFEIDQGDENTVVGATLCIPQVAIADDAYGWALIFGSGKVQATNAAITASIYARLGDAGEVSTGDGTDSIAGMLLPADAGTTDGRLVDCMVIFPKKVT